MTFAGYPILLSAGLTVAGVVLAGFPPGTISALGTAAIFVLLFAGLARGMLWVAWIAFIAMLAAVAVALAGVTAPSALPGWVLWGRLGANILAVVLLFAAIWRGPRPGPTR